jgi:hypothetical protein
VPIRVGYKSKLSASPGSRKTEGTKSLSLSLSLCSGDFGDGLSQAGLLNGFMIVACVSSRRRRDEETDEAKAKEE